MQQEHAGKRGPGTLGRACRPWPLRPWQMICNVAMEPNVGYVTLEGHEDKKSCDLVLDGLDTALFVPAPVNQEALARS